MSRFQVIDQRDKQKKGKRERKREREEGRRKVPLEEALVEGSGIGSTERTNEGMATFLDVRRSSARSFVVRFQSWTTLAEATDAASRGTVVEPAAVE